MRRVDDRVTAHTTFTLRLDGFRSGRRRRSVPGVQGHLRMRFLVSDPYAVHLRFSSGHAPDVEWVFARRLLAEGMYQQAGRGDVRVAPLPGSKGATIVIELNAPAGRALCEANAGAIAAFLYSTEQLVPFGAESQLIDMDMALTALLTPGGA